MAFKSSSASRAAFFSPPVSPSGPPCGQGIEYYQKYKNANAILLHAVQDQEILPRKKSH
jgi:hypothetical protein